jgi:hypothetical protein
VESTLPSFRRFDPEGVAALLWPLPRIGAQTSVAEHKPVPDQVADAQAQEACDGIACLKSGLEIWPAPDLDDTRLS